MPVLHLVHGFNVTDGGKKTVGTLEPFFKAKNRTVNVFSYGWVGLMGVRFLNPRIVNEFMKRVSPGEVAIGHSNGCLIIHMAAHFGAPLKTVIYINPALRRDLPLAPQVEACHVYSNSDDSIVRLARWFGLLAPWAPLGDPLWGDMGAIGYGPDQEVRDASYATNRFELGAHYLEKIGAKNIIARFAMRVFLGIPLTTSYWFVIGPIEVFTAVIRNNVQNPGRAASLSLKNIEDRRYILFGAIIPIISWLFLSFFLFQK